MRTWVRLAGMGLAAAVAAGCGVRESGDGPRVHKLTYSIFFPPMHI